MKQLVVISGKGGTGKTSLVGAFAALARGKVLADCDVDAADLHLILNPEIRETEAFHGSKEAVLNKEKCIQCGVCRKNCRFGAIDEEFNIDPFRCEGCGVCAYLCPVKAIELRPRLSGHVHVASTRFGTLVYGELAPGEGASGKLVTLVKQRALELARKEGHELVIVDGSPGIGCPVIASISGASAVLILTEPTLSGLHDLERVLGVAQHFRARSYIAINKHDLNPGMTRRIEDFARAEGLEVVGRIPYDEAVTEAMVQGQTVIEYGNDPAAQAMRQIWERMVEVLALEEVVA